MLGGVQLDGIYFTGEGLIENLTVTDEALEKKTSLPCRTTAEKQSTTLCCCPVPVPSAVNCCRKPPCCLTGAWLRKCRRGALSPVPEMLNAYPLLEENGDSGLFYRTDSRPTQLTGYLLYQALGQALDYFPYAKDSFSNTPLRYDCTGNLYARWSYDKVRADVVTALLPLGGIAAATPSPTPPLMAL